MLREWRVDPDGDQCQTHVGQPFERRIGVVLEDAIETRGIDKPNPPVTLHGWQFHAHADTPFAFSGFSASEMNSLICAQRHLFRAAVLKFHIRPFLGAVLNFRHRRSDRDYPDWQQRTADEVIQEAALPRFEPAENRNVEDFVFSERPAARQEVLKRGDLVAAADLRDGIQDLLGVRLCFI